MTAQATHLLTGAYALGALEQPDRRSFEAHLRSCPDCSDEVAGFAETVVLLTSLDSRRPGSRVRGDVLAAAVHDPLRHSWWHRRMAQRASVKNALFGSTG